MLQEKQKTLIYEIVKQEIINLQNRLPRILNSANRLSDSEEFVESCLFGWEIVNRMFSNIHE
jgi:hypothetical protein